MIKIIKFIFEINITFKNRIVKKNILEILGLDKYNMKKILFIY